MLTVSLVNILHTYFPVVMIVSTCIFSVFCLGTAPGDIQVGCLWQNDNIMTVSLSGSINYLDVNKPKTALKVIKVKAMAP